MEKERMMERKRETHKQRGKCNKENNVKRMSRNVTLSNWVGIGSTVQDGHFACLNDIDLRLAYDYF